MLHTTLIAIHAASGVAAFALGCLALRPRTQRIQGVSSTIRWYLATLWLLVLFLLLVVAVDWNTLDLGTRILYGALSVLALYTGWRGWQAVQNLRSRIAGWKGPYVDNVGFTLITLFDGFVIIAALDLHAPVWLAVVIGVLGVVVGRLGVQKAKERVATPQENEGVGSDVS